MEDVAERYNKLRGMVSNELSTESVATLVLASVVQDSLNQLPVELKYEVERHLASQVRG